MKFKKVIQYILTAIAFVPFDAIVPYAADKSYDESTEFSNLYNTSFHFEQEYKLTKYFVETKTKKLINTYIDYAVNGTKRIIENKNKTGYQSAVRKELPGAPCNAAHGTLHCLYGQYTQLNRAISAMGDTVQIIPSVNNAHMATSSFKRYMTKLYDNPEYPNAIYHGHLYSTSTEYNKALNNYITTKMHGKTGNLDSLRNKYIKDFKANNYCANDLNPGTIIIVSSGHAFMYLGQGEIKNKEFVPDKNGQAVCCSYNKEQPATLLSYWNTNNSFAADIKNIATQKYYEQLVKSRYKNY